MMNAKKFETRIKKLVADYRKRCIVVADALLIEALEDLDLVKKRRTTRGRK